MWQIARTMIPGREEQEPERTFTVPPELGGLRLDAVLARLAPDASRGRWKGAVRASLVRVGETTVKRPNRLMNPGETIHARLPAAAPSTDPAGRPIQELTVLHEDEAIVVVDKQPGLVVHPNERHGAGGTLADLLVERYGELPSIQSGPFPRPGIVHRLDRLTSGVMVVGRTVEALERLKAQFQERTVEKHYLALVHGVPRFSSEWLQKRIAPDPRNPRRVRVLHAARRGPGGNRELLRDGRRWYVETVQTEPERLARALAAAPAGPPWSGCSEADERL